MLTSAELAERRREAQEYWQQPEVEAHVERLRKMASVGIRSEAVDPEALRSLAHK